MRTFGVLVGASARTSFGLPISLVNDKGRYRQFYWLTVDCGGGREILSVLAGSRPSPLY
jgi:hypothetical protein